MSRLDEELITKVEEAIQSDMLCSENEICISCRYYQDAAETWKLIKNSEKNSYKYFASEGNGMTSYGFYKANNGEIYIIEAWVNMITKVYIPSKKWDCLKNIISDDNDEEIEE